MRKHLSPFIGPIVGITLLVIVAFVLTHKLRALNLEEVKWELMHIPPIRIIAALIITAVYYFFITGYDILALRIVGHPLHYRRIALSSFAGYAFGHNVGMSALSGGSIRYRIYSSFGLSAKNIAKIVGYISLSFWVGFLAMSSIVFLFFPMHLPPVLHLPFKTSQPIGLIALVCLLIYIWIVTHALHGKKIGSFELPYLKLKDVLEQILFGAGDLLIGTSVVFLLLPQAQVAGFLAFFRIYILAYVTGLSSQIPGGFGVFEGVFFLLLPRVSSKAALISALIVYRIIFYILPLLTAFLLLATHEVRLGRQRLRASRGQ